MRVQGGAEERERNREGEGEEEGWKEREERQGGEGLAQNPIFECGFRRRVFAEIPSFFLSFIPLLPPLLSLFPSEDDAAR